jgi:hypothetical protein
MISAPSSLSIRNGDDAATGVAFVAISSLE